VKELADRLTPDEKCSLEDLGQGQTRSNIPFDHAERFLGLGLAELSSGGLDLTIAGRQMLAAGQH
jgi:hypothetical protein